MFYGYECDLNAKKNEKIKSFYTYLININKHCLFFVLHQCHTFISFTACLEGYTSDTGQKCRPCSKHLYGKRCQNICSCSGPEMYAIRLR